MREDSYLIKETGSLQEFDCAFGCAGAPVWVAVEEECLDDV